MTTTLYNGTETFTFAEGMISSIKVNLGNEVDENIMPGSGAMGNIGIDVNGCTKIITIDGRLFDTDSSVTNVNNIRSKKMMKYWFEAFHAGNQSVRLFSSEFDQYSVVGVGTETMTDSVSGATITFQANFSLTKVYVKGITFDEEEGNPSLLPFSITLWVAGS